MTVNRVKAIFWGPMALKKSVRLKFGLFRKTVNQQNPFSFNGREAKNIPTLLSECGMNMSLQDMLDVDILYWINVGQLVGWLVGQSVGQSVRLSIGW